jgi:hypothetical protein
MQVGSTPTPTPTTNPDSDTNPPTRHPGETGLPQVTARRRGWGAKTLTVIPDREHGEAVDGELFDERQCGRK